MKKELLWAIITGFGLGLIITWGIISAKRAVKPAPPEKVVNEIIAPTPTIPPVLLKIDSPQNESIVDQDVIVLNGKSNPGAILTIFTQEDELIIEADQKGNFETNIELIGGANEINIFAFDEEGNEASASVTLVYSTAEI